MLCVSVFFRLLDIKLLLPGSQRPQGQEKSVCVCVCVCECMCTCVCVCMKERKKSNAKNGTVVYGILPAYYL